MRILQDKHIKLPSWQVKCGIFSAAFFKEYSWITNQVFVEVEFRVQNLRLAVRDHVWEKIDA